MQRAAHRYVGQRLFQHADSIAHRANGLRHIAGVALLLRCRAKIRRGCTKLWLWLTGQKCQLRLYAE